MKLFCPSCGNALEFRYDDSFVRVCDACHSAILRTDRGIDTLGQFADLAPASSGLVLHDTGRWQGQSFELMGRATYAHPAGGSWEEWYIKLADGRWAWLSHAEGRWALTFPSSRAPEVPAFDQLSPGTLLDLGVGAPLTVAERNQATLVSAEGEIPFVLVRSQVSRFADLSDARGRFATLDYGPPGDPEPPVLYLGQQLQFAELGLPRRAPEEAEAFPAGAGERLACPHCGGSIELRVPGSTLAVACPYCGSVLDCEGPLAILVVRDEPGKGAAIPLGSEGSFEGVKYTVTGLLRREAQDSSGTFGWDEYLLHAPGTGYRWLVCVQGHYSFVTELPPGAVSSAASDVMRYDGRDFQIFDKASPRVSEVYGEFYWKVRLGETVKARDYVAPPAMLSSEVSEGELHWSLGLYQSPADVRRAFGKLPLPDVSSGVASNQPYPHAQWRRVASYLLLGLLLCCFGRCVTASNRQVLDAKFDLRSAPVAGVQNQSVVVFSEPFELKGSKNVRVDLRTPLSNSWVYVAADLVNEATGQLRTFDAELSYYSGVDGGESWSEGSEDSSEVLSGGDAGRHVLRLEVQQPSSSPGKLSVQVHEDVFVWSHFLLALLGIGLPSLALLLFQYSFERTRWSQSDHAPALYASSGGDDDDE